MYPTLPLIQASIRDMCECVDFLMTELEYQDKVYIHDTFATYTYNGESLILVDTSVRRTIRLAQNILPSIQLIDSVPTPAPTDILIPDTENQSITPRRSVVIKDITGNAGNCPILISIAQNTSGTTSMQGQTEREYQMYVPWGSVEFLADGYQWFTTVPRSTCISNRGFRLPQNLNLALPPAIGAIRQHFKSMVYFPATMSGTDTVPSNYNGMSASVAYESQLLVADKTAYVTSIFSEPDPPPTPPSSVTELSITVDTVWNIPGDFPSLAAAMNWLSNKDIFPGVQVTLAVEGDNITQFVDFTHPQASQIVIYGRPPLTIFPESTSVFQIVPGAILVDVTLGVAELAMCPVGSYLVIDQVVAWNPGGGTPPPHEPGDLRRWAGAWQVVAHTHTIDGDNARILITDWGQLFSTDPMVPDQCRWRVFSNGGTMQDGTIVNNIINVSSTGQLYFGEDGFTIENICFHGYGGSAAAWTALVVRGVINLQTVAVSGFQNGIYGGYRAILVCGDIYSCSNINGIYLERHATLAGDANPSGTVMHLNGNSNVGLYVDSAAQAQINPVFCSGNQNWGLIAQELSELSLYNSFILRNGYGIGSDRNSIVSGNTNNIYENANYDMWAGNGAQIVLNATTAGTLATPNGQLNPDGSRIVVSNPTPVPVR